METVLGFRLVQFGMDRVLDDRQLRIYLLRGLLDLRMICLAFGEPVPRIVIFW